MFEFCTEMCYKCAKIEFYVCPRGPRTIFVHKHLIQNIKINFYFLFIFADPQKKKKDQKASWTCQSRSWSYW